MTKDSKLKTKYNIETGFFKNGLPFTRMGNQPNILVDIEALSIKHEPASGFELKIFIKTHILLAKEYTVYLIGRKPNLPGDYLMDKMANDYAELIKNEFKKPVDVMGISTGGQLAQYLAADHPELIRKLIILSSAYRLSEKGVEVERKTGDYFKQGKFGKSQATIMDLVFLPGLKRSFIKLFLRLLGKKMIGEVKYPNDFLTEIRADREMNFKDILKTIKVPTIVMSGELDIAYSSEDVRITAKEIPNAELLLYKGYGHNLSHSNTKQVQKDILSFLKK